MTQCMFENSCVAYLAGTLGDIATFSYGLNVRKSWISLDGRTKPPPVVTPLAATWLRKYTVPT